MMWATGFTSTTKVVSCRTGPGKILGPLPLTRFILLVTPVRCIGSGVWTLVFLFAYCASIFFWSRGQIVKGCKSKNKNNCITSILEIPHDSDWWMSHKASTRQKTDPTLGCATSGFVITIHWFVSQLGIQLPKKMPFPTTNPLPPHTAKYLASEGRFRFF